MKLFNANGKCIFEGTPNEAKAMGLIVNIPSFKNEGSISDKPKNGKTLTTSNGGKGSATKTNSSGKSKSGKNGKGSAATPTTKTTPKSGKVVKKRSKAELEAYHKFCQKFWQKAWESAEYKRLRSAKSRSEFNKSKLVELNAKVKAKGL